MCGSDLWRHRGISEVTQATAIGHEYVGIAEQVGDAVTTVKPGDLVVGGFLHSDGTCAVCAKSKHANCQHGGGFDGCQAEKIRIPDTDGTLLATPGQPDEDLIPNLRALFDVMCTGWHAAVSAGVEPGMSVVVVGDGAVGLSGVLAAAQMGATTIIAMSRHASRQQIAKGFGATHSIAERGEEGLAQVRALTDGIGADAVLECVGTEDARRQAVDHARHGAMIGLVGVPHGGLPTDELFWADEGIRGGVAPVRPYLPHLLNSVLRCEIDPGKVFDLTLPLSEVAEAYRVMDERRALDVLLQPRARSGPALPARRAHGSSSRAACSGHALQPDPVDWVRETTAMQQRLLGRAGVFVSPLALVAGINLLDTADAYSGGDSEEIVGLALQGRRDDVVLATKSFTPMDEKDPSARGAARRWIIREVENTLRLLGTDYLNLYQVHRPSPDTDVEETPGALTDLVRAGKVRSIGSSSCSGSQIVEAQWASRGDDQP